MWLKSRADCSGKIGVTGFCYGGSISNIRAARPELHLAAEAPSTAGARHEGSDPRKIKASGLRPSGEIDKRLAEGWPDTIAALKAASVTHEGYILSCL